MNELSAPVRTMRERMVELGRSHPAQIEYQVRARLPFPVEQLDGSLAIELPPMISESPPRYRKHFVGA